MRKIILSVLAVGVLLATSTVAPAEAQQPDSTGLKTVLVASVSGFDAISKDVQMIAQATGQGEMAAPLLLLAPQVGKGLDTTKPWGVVVQTDGTQFRVFGFVPVTDMQQTLALIKGFAQGADIPEPDADGVYEIETQGQTVFMAQKGGWAYLSDDKESLGEMPADPVPLLGGLDQSYAVAVRAVVANVPQALRDQVLLPIQAGLAMGQQRLPDEDETEEQYAIRKRTIARSMEEFTKLINETEAVQIGLGVEPQSQALRLDIEITAMEGSSVAAEYALAGEAKSDLTGFYLPDAALTLLVAGTLSESDVARMQDTIDTYGSRALDDLDEQEVSEEFTEDDRKLAKQILEDLIAVIRKTVESRRVDAGLALLADADSLNLLVGGFVADTATLEKLLKQLVHLAIAEDPGVENAITSDAEEHQGGRLEDSGLFVWLMRRITLNAEEHQGVRLHTLSVPADQLPEDAADLPPMLAGDTLTAAVGFSDQNVFLAFGPQSIDKLKAAIDQSKSAAGQSVTPMRLSVSATGIGQMMEGLGAAEDPDLPPEILSALTGAGENDHITIVTEAVPNGMRTRLELEAGILKVIGAAVGAAMSEFGPGGLPMPGGAPGQGGFPGQPQG